MIVESGAGLGALIPDEPMWRPARPSATRGPPTSSSRSPRRPPTRSARLSRRPDADRFPGPAQRRQPDRRAEGRRGAGLCGRGDSAYLPRPGDGRAVLAGQRRRLQGRAAGRVGVDPVLPDAHHRGGHRQAGHRAGARCRCCRPAGAGDGASVSAGAPPATTCVPRSPIRSARSVRSGWIWVSTPPVRAGTPASSPTTSGRSSSRRSRTPSRASTSSSPPRWFRVVPHRGWSPPPRWRA